MKPSVAILAVGVLSLASLSALAPPVQAAVACSVSYSTPSQWPDGFQGAITITNTGDAWSSWSLTFSFPGGQTATQGWGGRWSQSGAAVTVANESWNNSVGTGATVSPGFIGTGNGTTSTPSSFSVNGVHCSGGGGTTTTTTTTTTRPGTTTTTGARTTTTTTGPRTTTTTTRPTTTTTRPTTTTTRPTTTTTTGGSSGAAPALHVSGNKLLTSAGATYRLLGVNRSSAEFACVQGKGIWDGPQPDQASVDAMKAWNIHAVRIPLNEQCWLGTNGTPSGATYQQAVKDYADLLVANGINPILDLHWTYGLYTGDGSACSDAAATCQKPMPDAQYTPQFWTSVATMFKGNNAVLFDLFNEPWPDAPNGWNSDATWSCWRDGGTCGNLGFQAAGMQSLVDAVRATGSTNVIMLGGIEWSNNLDQWLAHKPTDSTGNLMASWHVYNFTGCSNTSCWDTKVAPVAAQVPVQAGEIGQNSCAHDFIDQVMAWADSHGVGYTAWTWNPWGCSGGNVLITDFNGTPTSSYGEGFKAHLLTQHP